MLEKGLAQALVVCGELERADLLASRGVENVARSGEAYWWTSWLTIRGQLRAAQERWDEARADFEEALRIAREHHRAVNLAETSQAYGEMLARRGEGEAARRRFEEALSIFRRMHAGPYAERTERALAELE